MKIQFIASVSVIAPNPTTSRKLFVEAPGVASGGGRGRRLLPQRTHRRQQALRRLALRQAAQACFGRPDSPVAYPVPQACVEFEVQDGPAVQAAAEELRGKGFTLLHEAREEPWEQPVARLQSVEGALIGISYAPWLHQGP